MQVDRITSRDGGLELVVHLSGRDGAVRLVLSREFLDDEAGDTADEARRRSWADDHLSSIIGAYLARVSGGVVQEPYGRITVEELD